MTSLLEGATPEPWRAWIMGKTICVLGPKGDHNKPVVGWSGFGSCHLPLSEQKANARLIAAAPTLAADNARLQALLNEALTCLNWIGGHDAAANGLSGFAAELVDSLTNEARIAAAKITQGPLPDVGGGIDIRSITAKLGDGQVEFVSPGGGRFTLGLNASTTLGHVVDCLTGKG